MAHFWSSVGSSYIEPKRDFQLIGVIDFIQPFLIQKMDKPSVTVETVQVKKLLKNGTMRVENHYKNDYKLNSINISAIDAYDSKQGSDLNKSSTLYNILTNGGYTATANDIGTSRALLRFPTFSILEIRPTPIKKSGGITNAILSAGASITSGLLGKGLNDSLGGFGAAETILGAAAAAFNFIDPFVAGVYTLENPVITSVNFGNGISYSTDGLVEVSLTIDYNNFRYEQAVI